MHYHQFFGAYTVKLLILYALLGFFFLLSLVKFPLFGSDGGKLSFLLIGIYFWTIYRPQFVPYVLIFITGILLDLLSGGLVGLNTLCFMIIGIIVRGQRRFLLGQSWPVVWAGYCVAVTIVMILHYLVYSLSSAIFLPFIPLIFNLVISYLLYPLVFPVMIILNKSLND
jgi:rod shape-determining protein MreD